MDIFHTGKDDANDDHKFINERLLDLALPDEPTDGRAVTLEECLELYFNNKIEVRRYLDMLERRNTINSVRSNNSIDYAKGHVAHIEVAELGDASQPSSPLPRSDPIPASPQPPTTQRHRAPSIIQEHYMSEKTAVFGSHSSSDEKRPQPGRPRKEVMMPAWQFFSLIPWYTDNIPNNDAQVAAHFSSTRPILGICLKRYAVRADGSTYKRPTIIDIPLEIGLPHFIQDDKMAADGPAFGNFKLLLQSAVCHKGSFVDSGHYISLVRSPDPHEEGNNRWLRFDDLAGERVIETDIEQFLSEESPYLLFYQVVPIEGDPGNIGDGENPPAYTRSSFSQGSEIDSGIAGLSVGTGATYLPNEDPNPQPQRPSLELRRPSADTSTSEETRGRSSMQRDRPQSVMFSGNNFRNSRAEDLGSSNLLPTQTDGLDALGSSRRGSKTSNTGSRSRPSSRVDDKRMSASLSRLANRLSRDKMNVRGQALLPSEAEKENGGSDVPAYRATDPPMGPMVPPLSLTAHNEQAADRNKLKKEAKNYNKGAQRNHQHLVKARRRDGKPDRECAVM